MIYQSTRNNDIRASSAQAILDGMAKDGGLYSPDSLDGLNFDWKAVLPLSTQAMAVKILASLLPSFSESFGLVLIEALACGKPVIGSDVGGITEIINDDVGLLVNPTKISSIAMAVDRLVNDENLRLVLSMNARNRALDFAVVDIPYEELKQ